MDITRIDHVAQCLSRIPEIYDEEQFQKFVSVYAEEIQIVEDTLLVLANMKSLDLAYGIWLDYIGSVIGVERETNQTDTDYRESIRLQIAINRSDGTPDVISDIISKFSETTSIHYVENKYAYMSLLVEGSKNMDKNLFKLITDIKPIGVGFSLYENIDGNAFVPSWRLSNVGEEEFFVSIDGVQDKFQVSVNGDGNYEDFFVRTDSTGYFGDSEETGQMAWGGDIKSLALEIDGVTYRLQTESDDLLTDLVFPFTGGTSDSISINLGGGLTDTMGIVTDGNKDVGVVDITAQGTGRPLAWAITQDSNIID